MLKNKTILKGLNIVNGVKQLLVGSVISLLAFNAQALFLIDGTLDMGGGAYLLDASGDVTNTAASAVAIDFNPNRFRVTAADGDFAGLFGSVGSIQNFSFDPFAGAITDFWVVGGFSFELTDVSREATSNDDSFLVLNGSGVISAAGFSDTAASWSYSSDTTGNGTFSWSAASNTQAVPEPAVLALLSIGLIGFGLRKKL